MRLTFGIILTLIACACSDKDLDKKDWPDKLTKLEIGKKFSDNENWLVKTTILN